MNNYRIIALKAVNYCEKGYAPNEAWEKASFEIFKDSISANKNCPKSTFLGLCESGMIKGIPLGKYTRSKKNKEYAITAVNYLKKTRGKNISAKDLWCVINNEGLTYNSQMDVVLELWNNNLIS